MKEVHTYNMIGNSIDVANKEMEGLRIGQNQETKSLETHEASLKEGKVADCNEAQDGDVEGDYPSQDGAPERRMDLFSRQILHRSLLMNSSLQENFLRVRSNGTRMIRHLMTLYSLILV
ncbi:uncharacterized protein LOC107304762 isoform X3 [Oryza brachyantha]|uniref:uncharacterized protein LOC107304762 isoform X3 n=1 Tax=Oryza brachyantha TaxID=4533 RepID=UPI0007763AED|nr:uncharacterized protein LOC107304762 isoform X3 [Oryza brachyantha]